LFPVEELLEKLERKASLLEFGFSSAFPFGGISSSSSKAANLFELLRSWLPQEPDRAFSPRSDTVGGG